MSNSQFRSGIVSICTPSLAQFMTSLLTILSHISVQLGKGPQSSNITRADSEGEDVGSAITPKARKNLSTPSFSAKGVASFKTAPASPPISSPSSATKESKTWTIEQIVAHRLMCMPRGLSKKELLTSNRWDTLNTLPTEAELDEILAVIATRNKHSRHILKPECCEGLRGDEYPYREGKGPGVGGGKGGAGRGVKAEEMGDGEFVAARGTGEEKAELKNKKLKNKKSKKRARDLEASQLDSKSVKTTPFAIEIPVPPRTDSTPSTQGITDPLSTAIAGACGDGYESHTEGGDEDEEAEGKESEEGGERERKEITPSPIGSVYEGEGMSISSAKEKTMKKYEKSEQKKKEKLLQFQGRCAIPSTKHLQDRRLTKSSPPNRSQHTLTILKHQSLLTLLRHRTAKLLTLKRTLRTTKRKMRARTADLRKMVKRVRVLEDMLDERMRERYDDQDEDMSGGVKEKKRGSERDPIPERFGEGWLEGMSAEEWFDGRRDMETDIEIEEE